MSTTVYVGERGKPQEEVTLHAGQAYIVLFKVALHRERMVAKFMEMQWSDLLFSLRPHAGTTKVNLDDIISMEPALKGALVETPKRMPR